jgi:hypothetical protein
MTQLTKNMYGTESRRTGNLFGLACGQMRGRQFVHNGGWYNKAGEKLGWGDLSVDDFMTIALELEEGEVFIVLHERASFWQFVTRPGLLGSDAQTAVDINSPGLDYVSENAAYIIAPCEIFVVDRHKFHENGEPCRLPASTNSSLLGTYIALENVRVKIAALVAA